MEDHREAISNHMVADVTIRGIEADPTAAAMTGAAEDLAVAAGEAGVGRLGNQEAAPLPGLTPLLKWTGTADSLLGCPAGITCLVLRPGCWPASTAWSVFKAQHQQV